MTRVHQASMINQHHNRSSDLCHKKSLYPCLFPHHMFSNHHKLYTIWKLKISKFILWKPFWNRTLPYHRNGTSKCFSRLLPLSGGVILQNVLRSFRIKTFYNLDEIHIVGKVWVSRFHIWWLFCYRCNIEREIDRFVTELHKKIIQWSFQWHPVAVFGITPKQNCVWTSIFFISTSNLEHNLCRHMAFIL